MVLTIGILSIVMLLGAKGLYEQQLLNASLVDAIRLIKIDTLIFHIMEEEVIGGETTRHVYGGLAEIDEAIALADFSNGRTGRGPIQENSENSELNSHSNEIRSLLILFRKQGLENMRNPATARIGSLIDQQFDAASNEIFKKASALELILEKNRVKNLKASKNLYWSILIVWIAVVGVAMGKLWRIELRRKQAETALQKANLQLFSQANELTAHRENLAELVKKRTSELTVANENLQREIAEHLQTEQILQESERQVRSLSFQQMRVQEIERRRISMELHDELGQALTVMKFRIGALGNASTKNPVVIKGDREQLLATLDNMIDEVRRLALALSPTILEDLGLTAAIRWLIRNFEETPDIKVWTDIEEIDHLFHQNYRLTLYRIIQEALTNVGRYAQAKNVSVMIRQRGDKVIFSIKDDGDGFNPEEILIRESPGKSFGLKTMEERVRMLGSVLNLQSRKGEGTRISFAISIGKLEG